ncbi:hypothetical protein E2562_022053 [Oryza meyeriana var. granulata]|uniref:Uncharacterized protein n=1 Tax=Oryza meyeriana var. granulata TaxID=110450 RepID=A0A6G1ENM9_9ORYZ|nr:hypothetical protein E2562_022053 [Oryza meyeriana var. granulata]
MAPDTGLKESSDGLKTRWRRVASAWRKLTIFRRRRSRLCSAAAAGKPSRRTDTAAAFRRRGHGELAEPRPGGGRLLPLAGHRRLSRREGGATAARSRFSPAAARVLEQ